VEAILVLIRLRPIYQQLAIHKIVIHRGDQVLNQLEPNRIRVIQQEKELDRPDLQWGKNGAAIFGKKFESGTGSNSLILFEAQPYEAGHFLTLCN